MQIGDLVDRLYREAFLSFGLTENSSISFDSALTLNANGGLVFTGPNPLGGSGRELYIPCPAALAPALAELQIAFTLIASSDLYLQALESSVLRDIRQSHPDGQLSVVRIDGGPNFRVVDQTGTVVGSHIANIPGLLIQ